MHTDAQLVPEQRSVPPSQLPPVYILGMSSYGTDVSLWLVWVSSPGWVPSQLLVPLQPSCWLGMRS